MSVWKRYHFSVGNSSTGHVGYCASVYARSEKEAVEALRGSIMEEYEGGQHEDRRIDYLAFYTNHKAITSKDIDDAEEVDKATAERLDEALKAGEERA